jgi:hypothetical protein
VDAQREAEHHDRMVGELEKVYDERDDARRLTEDSEKKIRDFIEKVEREFRAKRKK